MKRLVNGTLVEWSEKGESITATIDGREYRLEMAEVEPGVYSVLSDRNTHLVRLVGKPGAWIADSGHHSFDLEVADPRESRPGGRTPGTHGRQHISSPMPGKVIRVLVAVGDIVENGQGLVVVEAMKMQNELKAPKAGTVVAVNTATGAGVASGEVLVTLE